MYVYSVEGTLQDGEVGEGEIIPLSQYEYKKTPVGEITLHKHRKAASAEAIMRSGYDNAVRETDAAMLKDVQVDFRKRVFDYLNGTISDSSTASGVGLQAALADAWGKLQELFEDDTAAPVYFLNPQDISAYLGTANVSTQTAFGMNYIEDFLGLGTVITSARVTKGTFVATAKENLILYYLAMNGDVANAFQLTADELGYIGIKSGYPNEERAQIETLVIDGLELMVEYAKGVVKGTISGE